MAVHAPPPAAAEQLRPERPVADVLEDARARQQRHRRAGACVSLVVATAVVIGALSTGGAGGSPHTRSSVATGHGALAPAVVLRLQHGPSTTRFTITAPSNRAYDVIVTALAGSRLVLTMRINATTGWGVILPEDPSCATVAGQARCTPHFAAGGNPGGQCTGIVHKTTMPAERARVIVVFSPHAGDFDG